MKIFKIIIFTFSFFLFTFAVGKADAAVKTWNPAGCGSTSWNTAGNWSGGLPGTADIATFDGATSNCNVTVDTTIDVAGINITGSYTGTITQGNGNDISIRGSGYTQNASGSTFTGGDATSDITFTSAGGDFALTTGAFTAPAGTITVRDNWTISGGTFTASSGTIIFDLESDLAIVITGTATMNNVTFLHDNCLGGASISVASGTTITTNGTFTVDQETCGILAINGPGTVSAKGDIQAISNNTEDVGGDLIININGTSNQTLTGSGTAVATLPSITIDKTSGNLTLSGTIQLTNDFTYTQGSVDPGSSTVIFNYNTSYTLTGSVTLWNATFLEERCNGNFTIDVANGSNITVNNTLTLDQESCGTMSLDGPGTISAKGDLITIGNDTAYMDGDLVILVNGSGNQTMSESGSATGSFPGININKPSGNLTLSGTFQISNDFTYTKGNVIPGTSTVEFDQITPFTITGSVSLWNITFLQEHCLVNGTIDIASGTILTVNNDLTFNEDTCGHMTINGPGALYVKGNVTTIDNGDTIQGDVAITFNGSNDQIFTLDGIEFPTGTLTINKTAGTVTLGSDIYLLGSGQDLILASGVLNLGSHGLAVSDTTDISGQLNVPSGSMASVGVLTVASKGIWTQGSGSYVGLYGGVVNNGFIRFQGGGSVCGGSNDIEITSMGSPTTVPWSGGGTFIMNDVSAQDQTGSITAYNSTNVSGNNWTFVSGCPAYSNRSVSNTTGGSSFTGGTTFRSN